MMGVVIIILWAVIVLAELEPPDLPHKSLVIIAVLTALIDLVPRGGRK